MKNEMIIGILLCGIIGVSIGFVILAVPVENIKKMEIKNQEPNIINYTNFTLLLATRKNICEECHLSGKKYIPQSNEVKQHINGGVYCLTCHMISHSEHPVNENVTCIKCHGESAPKIPSSIDGEIVCNDCHGFPDALYSSNGNLISIHDPRGIGCLDCHINCNKCHNKNNVNDKWNKRINHLNAFFDIRNNN